MKLKRFFYLKYQTFFFSTGQLSIYSCLIFLRKSFGKTFGPKIEIDYFYNKLWFSLDQPKIFLNLIRFYRRYKLNPE